MSEVKKFKLSKPLSTHKGTISELELNPPTARSFIEHGSTHVMGRNGVMEADVKTILHFVSDMSGHDMLVLADIPGCDVWPLVNTVMSMLAVRPTNG